MRFFLLTFSLFIVSQCYSQSIGKVVLSGIILGADSIPVPDVAIINTRTNASVRTNSIGFFQTEITADDSLMAYHIAYKRRFITEKDNGRYIVMEPEIQELLQIDITNGEAQELKNLEETVNDVKRLANEKKMDGYDLKSRQNYFYELNGSHNKGFLPFFGPTFHIPFGKVVALIAGTDEKRQRKKLSSHYHLVKRKK